MRKAHRNSMKEVNHPLVSTPKDELQFLQEILGQAPKVTEVAGKVPSSPTSVKDSKLVNANSKEEATYSTSPSFSFNFREQMSSPTVHDAFLPESDKKAGAGLLLCENQMWLLLVYVMTTQVHLI